MYIAQIMIIRMSAANLLYDSLSNVTKYFLFCSVHIKMGIVA